MSKFRLMVIILCASVALGAFTASASGAVTFSLAEWLVNGAPLKVQLLTETSMEFLLEDTAFKAAVLCSALLDGWVEQNSLGWFSEVLTLGDGVVSTTALSAPGLMCTAQAGCETSHPVTVWAVNLGWETEAEEMEDPPAGKFFALLILPHAGGGNPGLEVECTILGVKSTDECTASPLVAELKPEIGAMSIKFSEAFTELAEAKLSTCTFGGGEKGIVEGDGVIDLSGGGELSL
jgi:hypothetical protein